MAAAGGAVGDPARSNEAAIIIKDSSLVYALGVPEILRRAQLIGASSQKYLLAYLSAITTSYWYPYHRLLNCLENKLSIPSHP